MRPVEIALVGCGAITQHSYLPALALAPEVQCRWLVDLRRDLARQLARRWRIAEAGDDYAKVVHEAEAVVLAVPNHLHAPMAVAALERRKPVLCEKPLARSVEEARRMVQAARNEGVPLVAGMIVRQYPGLQQIHQAFPWTALGRIQRIQASYGTPLNWPLERLDFFDRTQAGGGVLMELGVHALDALFWLLAPKHVTVSDYADDGAGGVEAEAGARLTLALPDEHGEVSCALMVSRLRPVTSTIVIEGTHGSRHVPLSSSPKTMVQCFAEQLRAFACCVRGLEANVAFAESQLQVLECVASCYRARQPLAFPWQTYEPWPER